MPAERPRVPELAEGGLAVPARSREWFARIAESMGAAFWIYDPRRAEVVYADPTLEKIWGIGVGVVPDAVNGTLTKLPNGIAKELHAIFARQSAGGSPQVLEYRLRRPDGSSVWIEVRFRKVYDAERDGELIVGASADITSLKEARAEAERAWSDLERRVRERTADLERANAALSREVMQRRRAERELRDSSARLQALLDHSFDLFCELDESGRFVEANARVTEVVGLSRQELVGLHFHALLRTPGDTESFAALLAGDEPRTVSGLNQIPARDRTPRHIEWCCTASPAREGRKRLIVLARDVTDRVVAEQRFHEFFQSAPDAGVILDSRREIVHFNRAAERLFGVGAAEVTGKDVSMLVPERYRATNVAVLTRILEEPGCLRTAGGQRVRIRRIDGCEVPVEINLAQLSTRDDVWLVAAIRDMSERQREENEKKLLEAQLRQWQKLESLGALAGGIAHDFNNLLAAVMNYANLALSRSGLDSPARNDVEQIKVAARRMSELATQMLTYAGRGTTEVKHVDLGQEVRQVRALLAASIPKSVVLDDAFASGLPAAAVDPVQLRQIIVNLVANAAEALQGREGRIGLRTGIIGPEDAGVIDGLLLFGRLPERAVYVEVSDTGEGMELETMERMFEPFYSTRKAGRGLGLAVVIGIVRRHGGAIGVESRHGGGTRILVALPASDVATSPSGSELARPGLAQGVRILLVDDEESVRESAAQLLAARGARVVACADGQSALRALLASASGFDAVLLDLTMPGMHGRAVLREIRALRSDLPVVLCTGYRPDAEALEPERDPYLLVATKPYDLDEVIESAMALPVRARGHGATVAPR